jgi:hypothetical protein
MFHVEYVVQRGTFRQKEIRDAAAESCTSVGHNTLVRSGIWVGICASPERSKDIISSISRHLAGCYISVISMVVCFRVILV